jgi:hypothetical protein
MTGIPGSLVQDLSVYLVVPVASVLYPEHIVSANRWNTHRHSGDALCSAPGASTERAGKNDVRIYDYGDVNLGLCITMFLKRLTT